MKKLGIRDNSYIGAMKKMLGITRRKVLLSEVESFRRANPNFNPKAFYAGCKRKQSAVSVQ